MKKIALTLALALAVLLLSGCGSDEAPQSAKTTDTVPEILNQAEYLLYENIFYNGYGPQYVGKDTTKQGVLATLQDAYSGRTRYYVWGYLDNTRCCDWQWEFVPQNASSLPPVGSVVTVTGVFDADESALDGYWIKNAQVRADTVYSGQTAEIDMCTMSCTLERVQMFNILYQSAAFEGKEFSAYGRIAAVDTLEDPYYDGSWQIPFAADTSSPAIGTSVTLRGTVKDASLAGCALTVNP